MSILEEQIGKKVTVFSVSSGMESKEVGTLDRVDENWIKLIKSDGEPLYFGIHVVRMVKPFDR